MVHTVKLTRAKIPANPGKFSYGLHVKRPHTQLTCVICSLPVNPDQYTRVYAASTSRKIHANCLQPRVYLLECNGQFTGKLPAKLEQICPRPQKCLLLQTKTTCNLQAKIPAIAGKKTNNCTQNYLQLHAKKTGNRRQKYLQMHTKVPVIAGQSTRNCRQSAITPRRYFTFKMQVR